jgi:predicted DNA-binding transcriptional regulator AlpA
MQKLLTFKDLLLIIGVSEVTLRRWIAAGTFVKPVTTGFKRKKFWNPADVERWMGSRDPPTPVQIESASQRSKRHAAAMKRLQSKGVRVPNSKPLDGGEP